jgi:hypothetical protein
MRTSILAIALSIVAAPLGAAEPPKLDPRFAPLAYLVGHCWRALFPDGKLRDLQCFSSMYGGKLVGNTHMVQGSEPLYQGQTIYSWDDAHQRIRFHYFTSTGAVSEGHFVPGADGAITIPERHVGKDGAVTELENTYRRDGEHAYRAVTRQKTAGGWKDVMNLRYVRTDMEASPEQRASVVHDGATWLLAWNSRRDGNYEVYRQEADGRQANISQRPGSEWAWSARGGELLVLSTERRDEEAKGWRAYRLRDGVMQRIGDEVVADGFVDCHPRDGRCAAEVMLDGRKRIAFFDRAGQRAGLLASDGGDDADPQWSPDGRSLLFRSSRGGSWELYRGDASGNGAKRLTSDAANDAVSKHEYGGEGPARWSPDGMRIVWMRKFPDRGYDVWTMAADGTGANNLTAAHAGNDAYPSFSPDGRWIAFDSNRDQANEIYVMAADGSHPRRITTSPGGNLAPLWVHAQVPAK